MRGWCSKNITINVSPRPFDRFVRNIANAPHGSLCEIDSDPKERVGVGLKNNFK